MVMDGLERALLEKYHKTKRQGKAYFPKVHFVCYADDFIVTGESFLGCNVKWYKDKLLIKPSDKNYKAVITKIRGIIKANPTLK